MSAPRFKGVPLDLGGTTYTVPPLSLGAIEDFEAQIIGFDAMTMVQQSAFVVQVTHRALLRNYPDLEIAELRELLDHTNMLQVFGAILGTSGLMESAGPGNPRAMASNGTGSPSMPTSSPVSAGPSRRRART